MQNRQLIAQAYLHTLAFALLAVGGVSLLDALLRHEPSPYQLLLPPDNVLLTLGLGMALLASVLLSLAVLRKYSSAAGGLRLDRRTLLAGLCGVLLSTACWYLLSQQHIQALSVQSELLLSRLQNATNDALNTRLALIRRMAERWQILGSMPAEALWQQETGSYLRDLQSIALIATLDERLEVHRSQARTLADRHWLDTFIADPQRRAWLEQVRRIGLPQLSTVLTLPGRTPTALMVVPLQLPGQPEQLLVASLDLGQVLGRLLDNHTGEFVIQVYEGSRLIHGPSAIAPHLLVPMGTREVGLPHTASWTLGIYFDRSRGQAGNHYLALLVLLSGLVLTCLLTFSQRLAWLAQQQARRLQEQQHYTEAQRRILGMISTLQPLPDILRETCLLIERQAPQLLSSVLQVDNSGQRLRLGAAPSLGERYNRAVDGLRIGEGMGACGSAAFLRKPVLVPDIAHDRRWKGFHQLAAEEGLQACWSTPLLAGNGELLGTFALYARGALQPDARLQELVATVGQLAAIAIEHRNTLAELERSNRELQEFAFVASHDLQEPLRKIQTFAERLQSGATGLDEQNRDYLQRMNSAAGRMQALIRDLLAYSRVATRRQPFVHLELEQLLDEVLQDMETTLESSGARLEREPLPAIDGDPAQIRQLLQNLLGNALKFHKPGETPMVRIYAEYQPSGEWSLCVNDQGVGFDEKYLDRIFQPFQRLHARQEYPGTGIGLAIVKKIAERHGARLSASSQPGEGATFRVTFRRVDKE